MRLIPDLIYAVLGACAILAGLRGFFDRRRDAMDSTTRRRHTRFNLSLVILPSMIMWFQFAEGHVSRNVWGGVGTVLGVVGILLLVSTDRLGSAKR